MRFPLFALAPTLAFVAAGFVAAPSAMAQSVAVIDFQSAVLATAEFEKSYDALTTKFQPVQDQIQKMQEELADIDTQLRAAAGQLSTAGQAELETRGTRTQRELERISQDAEENFTVERDEALRLISTRMQEVLKTMAETRGYDVVVELTVAPYFKDALDITQAAIDAYNMAYPAN